MVTGLPCMLGGPEKGSATPGWTQGLREPCSSLPAVGRGECWLLGGMQDAVGCGICQDTEPSVLSELQQCLKLRSLLLPY